MKNINRFNIATIILLVAYVLSACAGAPAAATSVGSGKPLAHPVTYLGVIEGINGDQWTINGITVTVPTDIVRDGPFNVGDQIKVEAVVNPDGSLAISRVEAASADDLSSLPDLGNENSNDDNSNDANSNDDDLNSNDDNGNDANSNDVLNSNDDNGNAANSNDANSNTNDGSNSNDDNGNDSNSNDDNGNDSGSNSNDDNGDDSNSNDDDSNSNGS